MRVVLQRVQRASVEVAGIHNGVVGEIQHGFLLLLGIAQGDSEKDADWLVEKILKLRLFSAGGKSAFDNNIVDVEGSLLVVSQFTLYGDCRKGTRPSFTDAAAPALAEELYEYFVRKCLEAGVHTETGKFGEHMDVSLVNDGPVTLVIDSP